MINTTNEGSKLYLYSITSVAILGGLLFGYDTAVISGAEKGLEAFFLSASDFQYNKVMHGITSSSALIGCVLGGAISGIFASRLGRRNSLRLAAVLFFLSALGSYYPEVLFFEYGKPNMDLLIAFNLYRVLGGIGVGLASAVCPMYIAEIAPSNIRGTLVSCNQFAIIFGMLVVYFVNYLIMGDHQNPIILKDAAGVLSVSSESDMWTVFEGWRFMFGSEAFPAAFFGLLLFFVPKTPRYLVLVQQDEKAYYHTGRSGHDRLRHLQTLYPSRGDDRRTVRIGGDRRHDHPGRHPLAGNVHRYPVAGAYRACAGEQHRPAVGRLAREGGRGDT